MAMEISGGLYVRENVEQTRRANHRANDGVLRSCLRD